MWCWFLQQNSSLKWPDEICKYRSQHPWARSVWGSWRGQGWVSLDSGWSKTSPVGDVAVATDCRFHIPSENESVLASFLKGLAGPESLSGNLSSMGATKISQDLDKMQQVKCHSSPSVRSPTGPWSLFYSVRSHLFKSEMLSFDLVHHSGKSSFTGSFTLAWEISPCYGSRNSLTTQTRKLLEIPEILSAGVGQMLRVVPLLPVQWKAHTRAMGRQGGAECCPVSWGLLGHSQSAHLKENGSRTVRGWYIIILFPPPNNGSSLFIMKH